MYGLVVKNMRLVYANWQDICIVLATGSLKATCQNTELSYKGPDRLFDQAF